MDGSVQTFAQVRCQDHHRGRRGRGWYRLNALLTVVAPPLSRRIERRDTTCGNTNLRRSVIKHGRCVLVMLQHSRTPAAPAPLPSHSSDPPLPHGCTLRAIGAADLQELGTVAAIDLQTARAIGDDARTAGQEWGRSTVWPPPAPLPPAAAAGRLLPDDLVEGLLSLTATMAGAGAE
eukprot:3905817-Prymnesium_polylepis.1